MDRPLDREAVAGVLRSTLLFGALDDDSLLSLAAVCRQRAYGKGQYLWYQGDPGTVLVIICSGLVKVMLASGHGDEVVLAMLGEHEAVGELSVLDGLPRSASIVAVQPTKVLLLDRSSVLEILGRRPEVLAAVLRALGHLVRRMTEQTGDLVFLDLGGRLAKLLLRLGGPPDEAGPVMLDAGLSQSDLAAMIGATRPAVNRALHTFVTRGLITIDGPVIALRDLPGLRRRADD
ncbi:MAG TPA: Crp/Fnr family transcriptional regulator [Nakamurella sp.]